MQVEQFPSFLSLENHELAEALRRLRDTDAAELRGSDQTAVGWVPWDGSEG
jgi:hypothetical protein